MSSSKATWRICVCWSLAHSIRRPYITAPDSHCPFLKASPAAHRPERQFRTTRLRSNRVAPSAYIKAPLLSGHSCLPSSLLLSPPPSLSHTTRMPARIKRERPAAVNIGLRSRMGAFGSSIHHRLIRCICNTRRRW